MKKKCSITQRANLEYSYTYACNSLSCFTTPAWAELLCYFERCWLLLDCFTLAERSLFQRSSVWCEVCLTEWETEEEKDRERGTERERCVCACVWHSYAFVTASRVCVVAVEFLLVFIHQEANVYPTEGQQGVVRYRWSLCTLTQSYIADVCGTKYLTLPSKCNKNYSNY